MVVIVLFYHLSFFQAKDGTESLHYLRSFCYMHRLLLQFVKEYPNLVQDARDAVTNFINQPDTRQVNTLMIVTVFTACNLLQNCAVVGTLLTHITLTGQKWSQLMDAYMLDIMDRNARRIVKEFPELNTTEPNERLYVPSIYTCNYCIIICFIVVLMPLEFLRVSQHSI